MNDNKCGSKFHILNIKSNLINVIFSNANNNYSSIKADNRLKFHITLYLIIIIVSSHNRQRGYVVNNHKINFNPNIKVTGSIEFVCTCQRILLTAALMRFSCAMQILISPV